jgi:hypothetical protein
VSLAQPRQGHVAQPGFILGRGLAKVASASPKRPCGRRSCPSRPWVYALSGACSRTQASQKPFCWHLARGAEINLLGVTGVRPVTFVQIAHSACEPEVVFVVGTTPHAGPEVLDFEWGRNQLLGCLAVATTITGLLPYAGIDSLRDRAGRHAYVGWSRPRSAASASASDLRTSACS